MSNPETDCTLCGMSYEDADHTICEQPDSSDDEEEKICIVCGMSYDDADHTDCENLSEEKKELAIKNYKISQILAKCNIYSWRNLNTLDDKLVITVDKEKFTPNVENEICIALSPILNKDQIQFNIIEGDYHFEYQCATADKKIVV